VPTYRVERALGSWDDGLNVLSAGRSAGLERNYRGRASAGAVSRLVFSSLTAGAGSLSMRVAVTCGPLDSGPPLANEFFLRYNILT
jgi:hypothetical protein